MADGVNGTGAAAASGNHLRNRSQTCSGCGRALAGRYGTIEKDFDREDGISIRKCAWRIWPLSDLMQSTECRNCTQSFSKRLFCRTFINCGRNDSATRPTASRTTLAACGESNVIRSAVRAIGDDWINDPLQLKDLAQCADTPGFKTDFFAAKQANKQRPARTHTQDCWRLQVDVDSIFDVQAKRIHEYKRQLLNVLHIVHQYLCLKEDGIAPASPHTYIFAGKAAAGYFMAKLIIQFIHAIADVVNGDPVASDWIKVAFSLPDYRVSLAEVINSGGRPQ